MPASPPLPSLRAHAFGATMEATLMSTWEQRVAFMKEEVPLPSSEPSAPLNKQPRSTPIPKKRSEKSLQPHSGSSVPEAGQRGRPRRPSQGQRSRWHGSGPERQLLSPPAPERGFPPWERGWGLSRGQEGPSCQVSATSGCGESPAHHIPLANFDKRRTSFQRCSVLHKRVHCGHELPGSGAGSVPQPESHARGPGLVCPLHGVGKHPQGLAQEPRGGSFLPLPAVGAQSWRECPAILPLGIRAPWSAPLSLPAFPRYSPSKRKARPSKLSPWGQVWRIPVFLNKVLLEQPCPFICMLCTAAFTLS